MANRLSKIYTRTGDKGSTSLASGKRVSKTDDIFEVMGDVDELNSHIGMSACFTQKSPITSDAFDLLQSLSIIQHLLFNLGGELAMMGSEYQYDGIEPKHIVWLENQIDLMNQQLSPLKEFILPAGDELMCHLHICRAVCRRAERHAIQLNENDKYQLNQSSLQFLNRLSDWLFVACRFVGLKRANQNIQEIYWNKAVLEVIDMSSNG